MSSRSVSFLGIILIVSAAYVFSKNRRSVRWRTIGWGLGLQFLVALFVLRTPLGFRLLAGFSRVVVWMLNFSFAGSKFVFGPLGDPQAGLGFTFAFQALPLIIFVACLFSILYYLRILPLFVLCVGKLMFKLMKTSGAESLEVAASMVMGQTEAPLVIRPYLKDLTESELMTIMTAGMAHIAGSVFGAYVMLGADPRHLLTAVVMTAPGTLLISKLLVPETGAPRTGGRAELVLEGRPVNILDAAARGVTDGLFLALNVAAMLIAFIALISLANGILSFAHTDFQSVLGRGLAPVAWILGVPWQDARAIGNLLGVKLVLNEFVAFSMLGPLKGHIAERSFTIATIALCGFANFASIGIQIGGIGSLEPSRKQDLARLGLRAVLAGTMANYLAAAIAGLLLTS
jgi:CNT family concentrative nucleoside transporter